MNMNKKEIIMKIPEDKYDRLMQQMRSDRNFNECEITELGEHGDLIDVDDIRVVELEDSLHIMRHEKGDELDVYIDAPTIIDSCRK